MTTTEHADTIHAEITADPSSAVNEVSPHLFGLFIEDINYACDGGLNANLVNNHSFEGVYLERGSIPFASPELTAEIGEAAVRELAVLTPAGRTHDRSRHWIVRRGVMTISDEAPVDGGAHFARVTSRGDAVIENRGYPGIRPSMGLTGPVTLAAWVRADDYRGGLEARLIDESGAITATETIPLSGLGWQEIIANLTPIASGLGALQLHLAGWGTLDIDEVTLVADDHWGSGDRRWSQGLLRRDLVEAMEGLAPRFIRFPGGCVVEGCGDGSQYNWKQTVGPIRARRSEYNLWGQFVADGDYSQSNQIGFYEYFLLCEDLGAEPIPVVWAGISCQVRTDHRLAMGGVEFASVVRDAIDLIDWATGDPSTNGWAALRAEAGHPEPFVLNYLGIGNENYGPDYRARFEAIRSAVEAHRPGISLILSTTNPDAPDTADTWTHARNLGERLIVDEHFYYGAEWMTAAATRYDDYPRGSARVFIGEWSAFPPNVIDVNRTQVSTVQLGQDPEEPNSWRSALAEAAFLTGIERNSDVVALAAYAPLLNLAENGQWAHNLINFNPTSVAPTVNYVVQQLFATSVGNLIVPVLGQLPEGLFASCTVDDLTLHLKLVNIESSPAEVIVRLGENVPSGEAAATILSAPSSASNWLRFRSAPHIELEAAERTIDVVDGVLALRLAPATVVRIRVPLAGGTHQSA